MQSPHRRASLALACAAALIAIAPLVHATGDSEGYVTAGSGRSVTDPYGECWHTSEWQPEMRFSSCEPRPAEPVAVEAPTPPSPPPAPIVVEALKPAPQPEPFTLSTDTLFDFDSATLKAESLQALDQLYERIAQSNYERVQITGHTDRVGAPSYNQRLSERRAQALRDYLVARGLDGTRISTHGVGSSEPVTPQGQCDGLRGAKLHDCLAQDRYAQLTVDGTLQLSSTSAGDAQ